MSKEDILTRYSRVDLDVSLLSDDGEDYYWNFWIPKEELSEYLENLLECLTDEERDVINLIIFEKYSFRKAKEQLEVDHASIFRRYRRILRKLYYQAIRLL